MKITGITDAAGEEVRALDFRVTAPVATGGTGTSTGKAVPADLIIKKNQSASTSDFFKKIVQSGTYPSVIFEYYSATDELYYRITISNVKLTQLFWLSPECPSCLKLKHQVGFTFNAYKTEDLVTGTVVSWNIATNTVQ